MKTCGRLRTDGRAGISLVDVIVGSGLFVLVFIGIFSALQGAVRLAEQNRLRTTAVALAAEQVEKIRAMPFDTIGTVGGLPPGTIPQVEDITHNGVVYSKRTFIQYVDDPADGLGALDTLAADYKVVKVELTYDLPIGPQSVSLVTTMAPKSQETLVGAGILRLVVNDASNNPVQGASVHVLNTVVATSVDVTTFTNASGTVSFPGAWAGTGYEIFVTKPGYSFAQTYQATTSNPNPSPSPLTVTVNSTTELFLKIDRVSPVSVTTQQVPQWDRIRDTFVDSSGLVSQTGTVVDGGALKLDSSLGSYSPTGTAESQTFTPATLGSWLLFSALQDVPVGTSIRYQVLADVGAGFVPIPATDLPGNDVGFTAPSIDLGPLLSTAYPSIRIRVTLETVDSLVTPTIDEWRVSYLEPNTVLPNEPFTFTSVTKSIGTNGLGSPIPKWQLTAVTNGMGTWSSSTIEWDQYDVAPLGSYAIAEACPPVPLVVDPATPVDLVFSLESQSPDTLSVQVASALGGLIPRAEATLTRGGVTVGTASGNCGVAYFGGLVPDTYTLEVRAPGHQATTTSITVSGYTTKDMVLEV